jgi:hypothetical protein
MVYIQIVLEKKILACIQPELELASSFFLTSFELTHDDSENVN